VDTCFDVTRYISSTQSPSFSDAMLCMVLLS